MNPRHRIALLIDADNTQPPLMDAVMARLLPLGDITIRRAFANWRKDTLKPWVDITMRHAIKAEQQFDYVKGKNATDMALTIAAMDLLHSGLYDSFAIVSSDSDFTPLALRLREAGMRIIGVGRENTPEAFRSCCAPFIPLESLAPPNKPAPPPGKKQQPTLEELHETLRRLAAEQGEDGYLDTGTAGSHLQQLYPGFKISKYGGRATITTFCGLHPELYEVKKGKGKGAKAYYRWLGEAPAAEAAPPAEAPEPEPEPAELVLSPVDAKVRETQAYFVDAFRDESLRKDDEGRLLLSTAAGAIRKAHPGYRANMQGYGGPTKFLKAFPGLFEVHEVKHSSTTVVSYRVKS